MKRIAVIVVSLVLLAVGCAPPPPPGTELCGEVTFDGHAIWNRPGHAFGSEMDFLVDAGEYVVRLFSADEDHELGHYPAQTEERWVLEGLDADGSVVVTTGATEDLAEASKTRVDDVGTHDFSGVTRVRPRHALGESGIHSSITPVKAQFWGDCSDEPPTEPVTVEIEHTVDVPAVPTNVELCLVADVSGSFGDDIAALQSQTSAITDIVDSADQATFGLAVFSDYPVSPFGASADVPYELRTPLVDAAPWVTAVNNMVLLDGGDGPESQLDAIHGASVGLDPWGPDCGWSGEAGATKILIATTDASCHEPDGTHQKSTDDVIETLNTNDIAFIGLASGLEAEGCFQPLADGTGGTVEDLATDGSNITAAIEAALTEISYDIVPVPGAGCEDLDALSFDPASYLGVSPGSSVTFTETVTYTGPGPFSCVVEFPPAASQTISLP